MFIYNQPNRNKDQQQHHPFDLVVIHEHGGAYKAFEKWDSNRNADSIFVDFTLSFFPV